jgi:hypothetical protein
MSKMPILLAILIGFGVSGCTTEPESIIEADNGTVTIDKEAFKQRVEARLHEFEAKLENLRNKAIEARVEVRANLRQDIDELHRKQQAARQRLAQMWHKGADKWEEEKLHMEAALDDLRDGFERAFAHVQ